MCFSDFRTAVINHLAWYRTEQPSCFMSVFDNLLQAINWAKKRVSNGHGPAVIYAIHGVKQETEHTPGNAMAINVAGYVNCVFSTVKRPRYINDAEYLIPNVVSRHRIKYKLTVYRSSDRVVKVDTKELAAVSGNLGSDQQLRKSYLQLLSQRKIFVEHDGLASREDDCDDTIDEMKFEADLDYWKDLISGRKHSVPGYRNKRAKEVSAVA